MKKKTAEAMTREMTTDERAIQHTTLAKYRENDVVPSIQQIARKTGTAINTVMSFMHGNSKNEKIRAYVRERAIKNLRPLPEDLVQLFKVWDETKKESQ